MTEALDKLILIKRVKAITGLSRKTIDRRERAGKFPRRIKEGESRFARVYWSQREVLEWIRQRKADRRPHERTAGEILQLAHQPKQRPPNKTSAKRVGAKARRFCAGDTDVDRHRRNIEQVRRSIDRRRA